MLKSINNLDISQNYKKTIKRTESVSFKGKETTITQVVDKGLKAASGAFASLGLASIVLNSKQLHDVKQTEENITRVNIDKIGLNDRDKKRLEQLLFGYYKSEEYQKIFNEVMKRKDLNIDEWKELFTGEYVIDDALGFKNYVNEALNIENFEVIMQRSKTLHPKDLKILALASYDNVQIFSEKNNQDEFIISDEILSKLSQIASLNKIKISNICSKNTNKKILTCSTNDKKIFTYDYEKCLFNFYDESGSEKILIVRDLVGNEKKMPYDKGFNVDLGKIIEETLYIKDCSGEIVEKLEYKKSEIEGIFNVIKTDLRTGEQVVLSQGFIDKNGNKVVKQSLISPLGVKTNVDYEERPTGEITYDIKIANKSGEILFETSRVRKVLNEFEMLYKINGNSFNVKFYGEDKIEILNNSTNQKVEIDLKALLYDVAVEERAELISMLKRIPADELLELNRLNVKKIIKVLDRGSCAEWRSDFIIKTVLDEFALLHELGHLKDHGKPGSKPNLSVDYDFLYAYDKEKIEYIKKYGEDDQRIRHLINVCALYDSSEEAFAEINALLSTPVSPFLRSYLFLENFPETIACAGKYLQR